MAKLSSTFVSTGLRPALKNPPALARDVAYKTKSSRPAKKITKRTKVSKTKGARSSRMATAMLDDVRILPAGAFAIHRDERAMNVTIAFFGLFAILLAILAITTTSLDYLPHGFIAP